MNAFKRTLVVILGALAAAASGASAGDSLGLYYPLDSQNPTGGPAGASGWTIVPFLAGAPPHRNDDASTALMALPHDFDYCIYGVTYTALYINNNGNITFGGPYGQYTPAGFPISTTMVAPFWADVDTRNANLAGRPSNLVYYQVFDNGTATVADDVFVVTWDQVGYYNSHNDKRNTFQVAIANDDNHYGPGLNTMFSYGFMEWTTGDASGGSGGFGGSSAVVGINEGIGAQRYSEHGRYNSAAGVATLNQIDLFFNGCVGSMQPLEPECETPPNRMVLWAPFEDPFGSPTADNLVYPFDGTVGGAGWIGNPGKVGTCACFDGSGIYFPHYGAIYLDHDITIDAWVNFSPQAVPWKHTIVDKRQQRFGSLRWQGYWLYLTNAGVLTLELNDGRGPRRITTMGGTVGPGWNFVAATVRRNCAGVTGDVCVDLYVNSNQHGTQSWSGETRAMGTTNGVKVGDDIASTSDNSFIGCIDEVEIFARALSEDELIDIYEADRAGKCKEFCLAEWNRAFYRESSIQVPVRVCNNTGAFHMYNIYVNAATCSPPGALTPAITYTPTAVGVANGACAYVWLTIPRPAFSAIGDTSCYTVCIANRDTDTLECCDGSVTWASDPWMTPWPPVRRPSVPIDGTLFDVGPIVVGPVDDNPLTQLFRVSVVDADFNPDLTAISLNGLPPGQPIEWFAKAPAGSTAELPLSVQFLVDDPTSHYRIVLEADRDGKGDFAVIDSFAITGVLANPCAPAVDEDFEFHPIGAVCGIEGFIPWQNGVDVCGTVSHDIAMNSVRSLRIVGSVGGSTGLGDDTVLPVSGVDSGVWTFSVMTYVPSDATGDGALILLNTYDDVTPPPSSWYSAQVRFRAGSALVQADFGAGITSLIKGQWVELRIEIDLAANSADYFYNGVQFVTDRPWTDGVIPGAHGPARLRAIDFYGGEPSSNGITGMYFDNVKVTPVCPLAGAADCNQNGIDDAVDIENGTSADCYYAGSGAGGSPDGIPDECQCVADWNNDGTVNSTDVSDFINTFFDDQTTGETNGDINCDDVSNSTDVSHYINLWFSALSGQLPYAGCSI